MTLFAVHLGISWWLFLPMPDHFVRKTDLVILRLGRERHTESALEHGMVCLVVAEAVPQIKCWYEEIVAVVCVR